MKTDSSVPLLKASEENMFEFLDDLRESGVTNMFGASPYLQVEFRIDKYKAKEVLLKWMETYE